MSELKEKFQVDFIGIGAPKCATTWISECLTEHPEIDFARNKETHFFLSPSFINKTFQGASGDDRVFYICRDWETYNKEFSFSPHKKARGEFSVLYMYDLETIKKIHSLYPDIKLLICLRNPADMLYSLYWFNRSSGVKVFAKPFEEILETDEIFRDRGFFFKHLKEIYKLVSSNNILVITTEEIKNDSSNVIAHVYKFIGVNQKFIPQSLHKKSNETLKLRSNLFAYMARKFAKIILKLNQPTLFQKLYGLYLSTNKKEFQYPPMSPIIRERIGRIYKKDIEDLERLLGKDLSSWKAH